MSEQELGKLPVGQDLVQEEDAIEVVETTEETAPEPEDAALPGELSEAEEADAALEAVGVEVPKVDLNSATMEELRQLPGIGDALATRIVNYRAEVGLFDDPAEITAVAGVSGAMYARLADRLSAVAAEPPSASEVGAALPEAEVLEEAPVLEVEPEPEEAVDWIDPEPELAEMEAAGPEGVPVLVSEPIAAEAGPVEVSEPDLEDAVEAPPRGPEPPLVEVVQARYGCWRLILVGLLSALLGAVLALVLLFMVNGTLDFQAAAIRAAQDEVLRMEGLVGALNVKVGELEERMGAIQELDARLTDAQAGIRRLSADLEDVKGRFESLAETQDALRQEFTNLREDLDGLSVHVSILDRRVSETEEQIAFLSRKIEVLGESIVRFDAFLAGLQVLLSESLGDLQPTPTPWITPMNTPTPWETPTLRPKVTVIPLATPTP